MRNSFCWLSFTTQSIFFYVLAHRSDTIEIQKNAKVVWPWLSSPYCLFRVSFYQMFTLNERSRTYISKSLIYNTYYHPSHVYIILIWYIHYTTHITFNNFFLSSHLFTTGIILNLSPILIQCRYVCMFVCVGGICMQNEEEEKLV